MTTPLAVAFRSRLARLSVLVLVATAAPLAALFWLGVRVLEQDREIERRQLQDRITLAADGLVAAIQRQISTTEQRFESGATDVPEGAVMLTVSNGVPTVQPRRRVAFLPAVTSLARVDDTRFADVDALLANRDADRALNLLRRLSRSPDRATRTGALLRLARTIESTGDTAAALRSYDGLSEIDDVLIGDAPASLAAAYLRCRGFEAHGRQAELVAEARRMSADLNAARWPLTAPVYWLYKRDALAWTGETAPGITPAESLAIGIATIWDQWRNLPMSAIPARGHESISTASTGNDRLTAVWTKTGDTLRVLLATPQFVHDDWRAAASHAAVQAGVAFSLGDATPPGDGGVLRSPAQTDLPWPIVVKGLGSSTERTEYPSRRGTLVAIFVLLVIMGLVAAAATVRAVSRELAVARLQSDFVSTVSHEFRTPLTTLRQFTERLRDNSTLAAADRAICYDAQWRATDRLTRLVESLLDFGRMQAGSRPYTLEPIDCADVVDHVVSEFERVHRAGAATIQLRREGPAPVLADREALSLAVWNLIDNAVKYSSAPAHVGVDVASAGDRVTVAVSDQGIGIPRNEQATIFEKFQRGQTARTQGFSGTGLGLAIVDHIVRAHRGRISVTSTVGEGSIFTISLPAQYPGTSRIEAGS